MDTYEAARELVKEFGVSQSDAVKALDREVDESAMWTNHTITVDDACKRIRNWILEADQYVVALDWRDIANFVTGSRFACVWAVMIGKSIKASKDNSEDKN